MSCTSWLDAATIASSNLTHALQLWAPAALFATLGNKQQQALEQLAQIFANSVSNTDNSVSNTDTSPRVAKISPILPLQSPRVPKPPLRVEIQHPTTLLLPIPTPKTIADPKGQRHTLLITLVISLPWTLSQQHQWASQSYQNILAILSPALTLAIQQSAAISARIPKPAPNGLDHLQTNLAALLTVSVRI
jgi:hypothetical protein